MQKPSRTIALLGLACVAFASARPAAAKSPYERLDQDKLAKKLVALKMTELLQSLVGRSAKGIKGTDLLVKSTLAKALVTKGQAKRDALLKKVIDLQTQLIDATKSTTDKDKKLQHYRYRLDRIITEGIHKVSPYADRLLYFLGSEEDKAAVRGYTKQAIAWLNVLQADMDLDNERWGGDWDAIAVGVVWKLEALMNEARYRGAWIRFYRAIVLPKTDATRQGLLQLVVGDLQQFANAEDNSDGVKFLSLNLSGMAAREAGLWKRAAEFLKRADDKDCPPFDRLKAKFEMVRLYIAQKQWAQADKQIGVFRTEGAQLKGVGQVAIDMQSALLRYKILADQAEPLKDADPARYHSLRGQAARKLQEFADKYPERRTAFLEIIEGLFAGTSADKVDPSMMVTMGIRELSKKTPEGREKAEKLFQAAAASEKTTAEQKAAGLWYLGLLYNEQRKNLEAARAWTDLAEKYPTDSNARHAAHNAVKSFQGILKEKGKQASDLGTDFMRAYARALEVLVSKWGDTDEIRRYNFELAILHEDLKQPEKAMAAFGRVPKASPEYLPAGFRMLQLRVKALLDAATMDSALRVRVGREIIYELTDYKARARKFAAKESDPERVKLVLSWGAECGLLVAQLQKDVLGNSAEAMKQAGEVRDDKDFKKVPGIGNRCQRLIIEVLLEQGKVEAIIPPLVKLIEEDPKSAENLLAQAVTQIDERIEQLSYATDAKSRQTLKGLRDAYKVFADKLYKFVSGSSLPEAQKIAVKQARAKAYEFDKAEAGKALEIYQELVKQKPNDASIVRGLARAHRVLGEHREAMGYYNKLLDGLPEKSAHWWRAQLERLLYGLEIYKQRDKDLKRMLLHIKRLRYKDQNLGGYVKQFNEIQGQTQQALRQSEKDAGEKSTGPL